MNLLIKVKSKEFNCKETFTKQKSKCFTIKEIRYNNNMERIKQYFNVLRDYYW